MRYTRQIRKLGAFAAFVLQICTLASGCGFERSSEQSDLAAGRNFKDDLGRQVQLSNRLDRVVSLAPNLTEMIFAAGAGDRLIGVTSYCDFPEEARRVRRVSDTQTPNIESIVALNPDVVFVSTASQLESFMPTLEDQKIAVFVTNPATLEDVLRHLTLFGEMFGTEEATSRKVAELEARVHASANRLVKHKSVFLQISKEPLFTIGKDSFLTGVIELAGGRSLTADVPSGYPKLSKETALALDPEVIILSDSEDNREPNDVFKRSPAVQNGRVYRIDADIISRPGPRIVDALEQISALLEN